MKKITKVQWAHKLAFIFVKFKIPLSLVIRELYTQWSSSRMEICFHTIENYSYIIAELQNMYTVNCLSRFCFNDPCDLISRDLTGLHQQCSELVIVSNRSTNHYSWAEFAHWVYALWTLTPVSPYHYSWAEFARWVYTLWTLTPMQTTDLFWTLKGNWLLKEIYVNFSSFFLGVGLVVGVYFLQTKELIRF